MLNLARIICAFLFMILCAVSSLAQQRSVAMTFDDLPVAATSDPSEVRYINNSILDALDRYHAPAIGFVIESRVQQIGESQGKALLDQWAKRGYDLGNHSLSHVDMNNLTVEEIEHEIVAGEGAFVAALAGVGKSPRYFRFPENHTGNTQEKHDVIAAFLAQRGYTVAVCTIDNEDYVFDGVYLKTLKNKDEISAARLRADYLAYTSTEIDYYTGLHKQIFGREIPHVMLLHANRLNADVIDSLLKLFEQKRYHFVTLSTALSDPAYSTPDTYATQYGWMWGYRWAKELGVKVNGSLETEPPPWILQYGKEQK
jgi:peptidoglycan/xylan/chitin deacetylase (PgdA/CDA1 family)